MLAFVREVYEKEFYETTFKHSNSLASLCDSLTSEDFEFALKLSVNAIQNVKQSAETMTYKEALSEELKKLEQKKEKEFLILKKELEDKLQEAQASVQASEFLLSAFRQKEEERISIALQKEESRNSLLLKQKEEQFERELYRLKESHDSVLKLIQQTNSDILSKSEKQQKEALDSLKAVLNEQEKRLRKEKVSSEIGKQGEKEFASIASDYFPWGSSLISTAKTPHSADLKGKIRECDVLFEIKMYSNDVPSKEVEKFERDMAENSNIPYGVMISLTSSITNKKDSSYITTKWTGKSQLLLFVNHFYNHSSKDTLDIIDFCADIAYRVWNISNSNETNESVESYSLLNSKLEQVKVLLDMELKNLSEFSRSLNHDKKFLIDKLNESYTRYSAHVTRIKSIFNQMLEIILGDSIQPALENESPTSESEPTLIPPKKRASKKKIVASTL